MAAALLLEAGHEVVGVTLKVWDRSRCCSLEDVEDARRVARHLGIPFYVFDAHEEFEADVVAPFVEAYRRGLTPNPCIACNRRVKFRWLLSRVLALGCDGVATGHYARLEGEPGARRLLKGVDSNKDQSYFLVPDDASVLDRILFPLGGRTKEEVRRLAAEKRIPVAQKTDSQDLCFIPDGDLGSFLAARLTGTSPGEIVDREGRVLGHHGGIHSYTIGQRKGLGVAGLEPRYVLRRDATGNRLVVACRQDLYTASLVADHPVWLAAVPESGRCTVKIRSTARAVGCRVIQQTDGGEPEVSVLFDRPQFGVAPGQMAVFYAGDLVLGGAWIAAGQG